MTVLSLDAASHGAITLGTFDKHAHLGPQTTTLSVGSSFYAVSSSSRIELILEEVLLLLLLLPVVPPLYALTKILTCHLIVMES
jgi:hypothetical protein